MEPNSKETETGTSSPTEATDRFVKAHRSRLEGNPRAIAAWWEGHINALIATVGAGGLGGVALASLLSNNPEGALVAGLAGLGLEGLSILGLKTAEAAKETM